MKMTSPLRSRVDPDAYTHSSDRENSMTGPIDQDCFIPPLQDVGPHLASVFEANEHVLV